MRKLLLAPLFALLATTALASEPGTPMDCSDLELAPGLTCAPLSAPGEGGFRSDVAAAIDNEGRIINGSDGSSADTLEQLGACGIKSLRKMGLVFTVAEGAVRTPIIAVSDRCLDAAMSTNESLRIGSVLFDPLRGVLFVNMNSRCSNQDFAPCPGYGGGLWFARIDGFAPLGDVLPPPAPQCSNGIDDDGDGAIDLDDCLCRNDADNDESSAPGRFGWRKGCRPHTTPK